MIEASSLPKQIVDTLRSHVSGRLEGMRQDRMSFWAHWSQLAEMFLPRRYKWFVTANQHNRGTAINSSLVDETGVLAARTLASGMMSGLTSPLRPWFKLRLPSEDSDEYGPVRQWLAEVEKRMAEVFSGSNFYQGLAVLYHDLSVFGSASMLIYEDPEQVIRCYNPCLGEFFFGASARLDIDSHYREFTLTIGQAADQFGLANLCESTRLAYQQGGAARQREIIICHAIEPNTMLWEMGEKPVGYAVPKKFRYREVYWEQGKENHLLRVAGFNDKPFVGARWDTVSNDAYGRSPGMDAMPAVRQLQIEQRRKAEAIDKMVRPPLNASVSMKNEPTSILPGAINYVADVAGSGLKPVYQVDPRLAEMLEDIQEVQARVKAIFFVDLFMMISQLETVRTATEIDARREEKLIQLGPVIERFENEVLDPIVTRVFNIMMRRGLLPPPPEEAQGSISIQYVSMLAEAQRATSTTGIERLFAFAGNLTAVDETIMDNLDGDEAIEEMASALGVSPHIVRSAKAVAQLRLERAKQAQAQQAQEQSLAAVQGANVLSKTDVGGGQNALSMMMGGQQ
jgi:hypothetical protein